MRTFCPKTRESIGTRSSMPWNMPVKSRSAGRRSGAKPKPAIPSSARALLSVPPPHQVRDDGHSRIVFAEHRHHRVDERTGERNLEADVGVHDLDVDVVSDDAPDIGECCLLGSRQDAHVDQRLGVVGDHIVFVSCGQSGRVGRCAEGRAQKPLGRSRVSGQGIGIARVATGESGETVEKLACRRREPHGPLGATESGDGLCEARDRVVGMKARAVARASVCSELDPDQRLLAHLQQ